MKKIFVLVVVFFCIVGSLSGFNYLFELENRQFNSESHNSIRIDAIHWLSNVCDSTGYLGFYSYSELDPESVRSQAGLVYHWSNGLQSNLGLGLIQGESQLCANVGLSFHKHHHLAELQIDVDRQVIVRGFYNYALSSWLELGIYGRTHYGIGPRITLSPFEHFHLALCYTHETKHNSLISQLLIRF